MRENQNLKDQTPGKELPILANSAEKPEKSVKSGRGKVRAIVLLAVHAVILLHITHYHFTGRSVSPVEPSESMYALELGHINAGTIFFGLAILSTAIFGRFFCGWGCHIVALQDLCSYVLRKFGIRPKPLRSRLLILTPFAVAFYMFLWPTINRLWHGNQHPGFSNHLMTENFWITFPGPLVSVLTFAVCGGVVVYLLGNKGFCTYACPYGAFFSISDRIAPGRIRVTDACQHCGQCTAHCTSNVSIHKEVKEYGMVVDPGCMKCMDCVSVCPNDALYFGLSLRDGGSAYDAVPKSKKKYDYSLAEEFAGMAVGLFTVFAMRGLYDATPFLLTIALAAISAYATIQLIRVFKVRDLRIQNFRIKRENQITTAGIITVMLILGWFAFNFHSYFVQHHRWQGRHHLSKVNIVWEELLVPNQSLNFPQSDLNNINAAAKHFEIADRYGLIDIVEIKLGLAIGALARNDVASGEAYIRSAYAKNPNAFRELLMTFLVSQDRQDEALKLMPASSEH